MLTIQTIYVLSKVITNACNIIWLNFLRQSIPSPPREFSGVLWNGLPLEDLQSFFGLKLIQWESA